MIRVENVFSLENTLPIQLSSHNLHMIDRFTADYSAHNYISCSSSSGLQTFRNVLMDLI